MSGKEGKPYLRVLMTGDTVGGVWNFTLALANALASVRVEVVLATAGKMPSFDQVEEALRVENLVLIPSAYKMEWMEDPWADVAASGHWLMQLEREYSPNVIHLNSFAHGALPWNAPTVLTAHSCVLSWWDAVKKENAPASWNRYKAEVTIALQSVNRVTAPSSAMAATLLKHYQVSAQVIPNGLDAAQYRCAAKEPFIFTAGRLWDEGKNIVAVADLASSLEWPVYIAGDSGDLHLSGVNVLGRLSSDEIKSWYARASIYVHPARYEPFGLSVLEAALSGCALVLCDIPSLRELWLDAADFVPPDDCAALRIALDDLTRDNARRARMSELAYQRALSYSAHQMAELFLGAYQHAEVTCRSRQCIS